MDELEKPVTGSCVQVASVDKKSQYEESWLLHQLY